MKLMFVFLLVGPLVFIANSPLLVQQNSNASLSCITIDGLVNTTFLWSRVDGEPLSNRVDGDDSRILTIVGVTEEDEGEYMCITSTEAQAIATTVILTVYGKSLGSLLSNLICIIRFDLSVEAYVYYQLCYIIDVKLQTFQG